MLPEIQILPQAPESVTRQHTSWSRLYIEKEAGRRYMRISFRIAVSGVTLVVASQFSQVASTTPIHYYSRSIKGKTDQSMHHAFARLVQAVICVLAWCLHFKLLFPTITLSSALYLPDLPPQLSSDPSSLPAPLRNLTTHDNSPSSTWPPTPFTIRNINNDVDHPAWMRVINTGTRFTPEESTSIDWAIHILLVRLSELDRNDPCPNYEAVSSETMLKLDVRPQRLPTVALCVRAITLCEHLMQKYGSREVIFTFGKGKEITMQQGLFAIALRPLPSNLGTGQS